MNIKKLKEIIKDLPDNMIVIADGEYGYGTGIGNAYVSEKVFLDEEDASKPKDVLCMSIDSYIFESEDVGCATMYLDTNDAKEFLEGE